MRLGISNLAWPYADTKQVLVQLRGLGVAGIEVAPTRISEWDDLSGDKVKHYRREVESAGLQISSLQAIFFGRSGEQLLGDEFSFARMAEHLRLVANIAAELGASVAVFGAPRNRHRGTLSPEDAIKRATSRLRILGDIAYAHRLVLAIEPVPSTYGCDFLLNACEVRNLVSLCDHPGISTHLDSACISLAGDDITNEIMVTGKALVHYHIAEPNLGTFYKPTLSHQSAGEALRNIKFSGWSIIEMREDPNFLAAIESAVSYAKRVYQ
jgi:sugar phosphate isomerase/epimerase